VVGLLGLGGATAVMLTVPRVSSTALTSGTHISVARFKPMRDAGVLDLDEVPKAYHDETRSQNGTQACALTKNRIVRVADQNAWELPYASITDVTFEGEESTGMIVTSIGEIDGVPIQLACSFRAKEGGIRFFRQVQTEKMRHQK
jgi:hypothetical protein